MNLLIVSPAILTDKITEPSPGLSGLDCVPFNLVLLWPENSFPAQAFLLISSGGFNTQFIARYSHQESVLDYF